MRRLPCGFLFACSLWTLTVPIAQAQSYKFSTIAGVAGQSGSVNGTNGGATFNRPWGLAMDAGGSLYVADANNHTIRKLTRAGNNWVVSTLAGWAGQWGTNDGAGTAARFRNPYGIAVDNSTNLYVADANNHTIRKVTPVGTNWVVSTLAGQPGVPGVRDSSEGTAQFRQPSGVVVNNEGDIFVADGANHAIRHVTAAGWVSTVAGLRGTSGFADGTGSSARFYNPSGLALDSAGNIYVADTFNSTIRRITANEMNWIVTTLAGDRRFTGSDDGTNNNALFLYPGGVAVDSMTNIFVADTVNNTIRKVVPSGTNWVVSTLAGQGALQPGTNDGVSTAAQFNRPYGVAANGAGDLFVADTYNQTIRLGVITYGLKYFATPGQLVVSWPVAASNFLLESSSSVLPNASWAPVTTGIFVSGDSFVRTNNSTMPAGFYRLRRQ